MISAFSEAPCAPAVAVFTAWLLLGCGGAAVQAGTSPRERVTRQSAPSDVGAADPAEAAWAQRDDAAAAQRAAELWTQRAAQERDVDSWLAVARAEHFIATVHSHDRAQVLSHAEAGLKAAHNALREVDDSLIARLQTPGAALDDVTHVSAPALYWYARLLLLVGNARGYAETLIADESIERALRACERVLDSYDHFGAITLIAQRLARPLSVVRRDLPQARRLFERVIASEPELLAHRVAFAQHYAVIAADRAIFERELRMVIDSPSSATDSADQRIARAQAASLMQQTNELFE